MPLSPEDETVGLLGLSLSEESRQEKLRNLSRAELEVVLWMCRGHTDLAEIGGKLHRSPHTVRTQLGSIFRKLEVRTRDQLLSLLRRAN